jgi:hypothetical protein
MLIVFIGFKKLLQDDSFRVLVCILWHVLQARIQAIGKYIFNLNKIMLKIIIIIIINFWCQIQIFKIK